MDFEVIGEITEVETFAVGKAILCSHGCGACMEPGAGENARASLECAWLIVPSAKPNCTGTRHTVLAEKK